MERLANTKGVRSSAYLGRSIQRSAVSSLAAAATRSAIDGTSFGDNLRAVIPDIIGQAVGDAIAFRLPMPKEQVEDEPVDKTGGSSAKTPVSSMPSEDLLQKIRALLSDSDGGLIHKVAGRARRR